MAQAFGGVTDTNLEAVQPDVTLDDSFPWPPRPGSSPLDAFFATWTEVCFHPTSFYRRMPREDPYVPVIIYYLIVGVIAAGVRLFWQTVLGDVSARLEGMIIPAKLAGTASTSGIVDFLLSPILLLVTLYLVSGVCHVLLLMMRDAKHGFGTTSRVFAFSYSPALFGVVPVLGNLVAFVWMLVLAIIGLREAHASDGAKAAVAVLVPVFLLIVLVVLGAMLALAMGLLNTRI